MHFDRWYRIGSAEGVGGGADQQARTAKMHCPHVHEYTPQNTSVYASDGRRRCRACREGR